ncbi:MAG: hypothetical protein AAF726_16165 [Planctomycetota bacterium]
MRARFTHLAAAASLLTASAFAGDYRVTIDGSVLITVPTPLGAPFTNVTIGAPVQIVAEFDGPPNVVTSTVFQYPLDATSGGVTIGGVTYSYLPSFGDLTIFDDQLSGDVITITAEVVTPGPVLTMAFGFADPTGTSLSSPNVADLDGRTLQSNVSTGISITGGLQNATSSLVIAVNASTMRFQDLGGGGGGIGMAYCNAAQNSTGATGRTRATGSRIASANNLTLAATNLPNNTFGFFLTSQSQGFVQNPGGSSGNLCLGGAVGRYVGPGQVKNSGLSGSFALQLNLSQTPTPNGLVAVQAGQTWNFTAWFRDSAGGSVTSNFTDGFAVSFL